MTDHRADLCSGADAPRPARYGAVSRPIHDCGTQSSSGREESHSSKADEVAVEVVNFAARTGGHIAYVHGFGLGEAIVVCSDTLLSARTWKNEFR